MLTKTFSEGELYVFISYARTDQAVAEKVEAFLTAAGVRVFRDASDIGAGANWDMTIEQALRECHCMTLLLSEASMPFRKEVHREWFNFDQKGKTIYPLYIQDCELHSRFDSRNYIDARGDLQGALTRLLNDLRRDFKIAAQAPDDVLSEYRRARIAEWSAPRYYLDKRFVNLTLLLDKGESEPQRWHRAEDFRFSDMRDGSWNCDHINARAVYRNNNYPADRNHNIGFRVVVVLRPTPPSLFNGLAARAVGGLLPFIRVSGFRQCWPSTRFQPRILLARMMSASLGDLEIS